MLYAKQSVRLSMDFFESAGPQASIVPFEKSLGKVTQMTEGWHQQNITKPPGCTALLSRMNVFVSSDRRQLALLEIGDRPQDRGVELVQWLCIGELLRQIRIGQGRLADRDDVGALFQRGASMR